MANFAGRKMQSPAQRRPDTTDCLRKLSGSIRHEVAQLRLTIGVTGSLTIMRTTAWKNARPAVQKFKARICGTTHRLSVLLPLTLSGSLIWWGMHINPWKTAGTTTMWALPPTAQLGQRANATSAFPLGLTGWRMAHFCVWRLVILAPQ